MAAAPTRARRPSGVRRCGATALLRKLENTPINLPLTPSLARRGHPSSIPRLSESVDKCDTPFDKVTLSGPSPLGSSPQPLRLSLSKPRFGENRQTLPRRGEGRLSFIPLRAVDGPSRGRSRSRSCSPGARRLRGAPRFCRRAAARCGGGGRRHFHHGSRGARSRRRELRLDRIEHRLDLRRHDHPERTALGDRRLVAAGKPSAPARGGGRARRAVPVLPLHGGGGGVQRGPRGAVRLLRRPVGMRPGAPYCHCGAGIDCARRVALWPGDPVATAPGEGLAYFQKLVIGVAPYDFRHVGDGVVRFAEGDAVARRASIAAGVSPLLFSAPEPNFLHAVPGRGAAESFLYVYGTIERGDCTSDVVVSRVARDRAGQRAAYEFWNGRDWSAALAAARPILTGIAGQLGSVMWDDYLGRYLSAFSDACTGGNQLHVRSAPRPEGPWSEPAGRRSRPARRHAGVLRRHPAPRPRHRAHCLLQLLRAGPGLRRSGPPRPPAARMRRRGSASRHR